ncbi:4417_t:CDS:2 [Paraglomus brasilianum]|uniref:4417_t:CDS:1 n=1 Tax=Paraglomus brasilianum TaxID=144538 RepID=A0A9N9AHR6_9GLOM|nr:4417_t:CDS:2 [Paraglomus brasilianum]
MDTLFTDLDGPSSQQAFLGETIKPALIGKWTQHLRPGVEKVPWSQLEIDELILGYSINGPDWIKIIEKLPGRSSLQARNMLSSIKKSNKRIKDRMSVKRLLNAT